MKKSRYTEGQIVKALKEEESGRSVNDISRELGINKQTFYNWKKKYAGLMPDEMRRLRALEDENGRLKKIVADLTLDREMLQVKAV